MSVPKDIREHLRTKSYEAVEEAFLERLEDDVRDVETLADVGTALVRAGEDDRARVLLDMVDEQLIDAEAWEERLELLRRSGELLYPANKLHPQILRTLKKIYGEVSSYEEMVEKVGLRRAPDDIPKAWKKADRLASLLAYDVGSVILLEGKGAGKVIEVNMTLESFLIDLMDHPELRVGFGGAAKLLKPLPQDHVLRLKMDESEKLEALRDGAPQELLRLVLESYDEPLTGAEIRRDLAGIVAEGKWSSWWSSARKHPQILAVPGKRKAYTWAASRGDAQDAVWQDFEAADPRAKIDLLRQSSGRAEDLKTRMAESLGRLAAEIVDERPALACEIWYALNRYAEAPSAVPWSPSALLARLSVQEMANVATEIRERTLRERLYRVAAESRDDWPELANELLWQDSDAKALDLLAASLKEKDPDSFGSFLDQLVSQAKKHPAGFTWFLERAKDEPDWLRRNPPRLLRQFLWALNSDLFASMKTRLEPLVESGGTLPRLLDHLTEEQAAQIDEILAKAPALQDYQRDLLRNALHLRFPELRQTEAPHYATQASIDRKREELRVLLEEEIPANRRAIEEAREMGDLRENFEYKSARQRHEYLASRASSLDDDLRRARPIDSGTVTGNEVVIGSRVTFEDTAGKTRTITFLGPWESEPEKHILSNESELAQSLLGQKTGSEVKLDDGTYRITSIEPYD